MRYIPFFILFLIFLGSCSSLSSLFAKNQITGAVVVEDITQQSTDQTGNTDKTRDISEASETESETESDSAAEENTAIENSETEPASSASEDDTASSSSGGSGGGGSSSSSDDTSNNEEDNTEVISDGDGVADSSDVCEGYDDTIDKNENGIADCTEDNDGDNLSDYEESLQGTNPLDNDSDDDMYTDGDEVNTYHTDPTTPDIVPIYVSIFSHNEEAYSSGYPNFVEDKIAFWQQRNDVLDFATMLAEEGVMYNYQSDWTFLLAMSMYDDGTPSTNNKNLVRYLKEDFGFEVDPHAHESKYNYADVAYLIEQLGVEPSQTVGGALLLPAENSKLEYLWEPLTGWQYPSYTWKAKVIMGGGTIKHQDEEALWISGIWKPQDDENTLVHDDDAPLATIGTYGRRNSNDYTLGKHIDELLELQKQGLLVPGKIYTASLSLRQDEFTDVYIEEFREMIQGYEQETEEGRIIWIGFDELYNIWLTEYDGEANQLHYLDIHPE